MCALTDEIPTQAGLLADLPSPSPASGPWSPLLCTQRWFGHQAQLTAAFSGPRRSTLSCPSCPSGSVPHPPRAAAPPGAWRWEPDSSARPSCPTPSRTVPPCAGKLSGPPIRPAPKTGISAPVCVPEASPGRDSRGPGQGLEVAILAAGSLFLLVSSFSVCLAGFVRQRRGRPAREAGVRVRTLTQRRHMQD